MQLRKVSSTSKELPELVELYERAFPAKERWGMDMVLKDTTGISELYSFMEGEAFLGFVIMLNYGALTHIIYFAVDDRQRSRGIGSEALRQIRALKPEQTILVDIEREVPEADNNDQRRRRKAFYERNGYEEAKVYYSWNGENYEIMILGGKITSREYFRFWHSIDENSSIFEN